tara:strand:+ start:382 stop:1029 length:648 start_codon:yes stop_codon:yes gene_type:complete
MTDLKKRIATSILLLSLLFLGFKNIIILSIILFFIFVEIFNEFQIILKKIFLKKKLFLFAILVLIQLYTLYLLSLIFFPFVQNDSQKINYLFLIISICITSDIGGYIVGNIVKGKKLTKISPKKTYSGMIGSFIFSLIISSVLFKDLVSIQSLIIFIFLISLISQIGDILISLLKRTAKLKDTGNILPGHGGLLDRFDGLFFAIPLGFMISRYLW